jgi:glycine dehydrogenase subunit 2
MIKQQLIHDLSQPGKGKYSFTRSEVPLVEFPEELQRRSATGLPEVAEPELVRHYTNLSVKNHHVDRDFYPLGSCTMKYNPRVNERLARGFNFGNAHPELPEENVQGNLALLWELQQSLQTITGFSATSLQPVAGAHGELTALLMIRKYHEQKGNPRRVVIIPDSSHGTNPASIHFAGYEVKQLKSNEQGKIDLDELASHLNEEVAAFMITNPNTLGLFESNIAEICRMTHEVGGLVYLDGANLNALMGLAQPVDMGFDVMHINVHKTFSTPHGGGGPGGGPVLCNDTLAPYLPVPVVTRDEAGFHLDSERPLSIGRVHSWNGNFMVMLRALAYIRKLGGEGIRAASQQAIINANYVRKHLEDYFELPYKGNTLHEVVFSGRSLKQYGVKTVDIAKRLLDYGMHAPTVYFPLIVPEALMIEPTETESKLTLDRFIETMIKIVEEAKSDPELLLNAPVNTPVRRLNDVVAVKRSDLGYRKPDGGVSTENK